MAAITAAQKMGYAKARKSEKNRMDTNPSAPRKM
jgi:hypothetical protein